MKHKLLPIKRSTLMLFVSALMALSTQAQYGTITFIGQSFSNSTLHLEAAGSPLAAYYTGSNLFVQLGPPALSSTGFNQESGSCTISGLVHTSNGLLEDGRIFLIDSISQSLVDSFIVNQGIFQMRNIAAGTYHILAIPRGEAAASYIPTYYVSQADIDRSTPIPIHADITEIGSIDIHLLNINYPTSDLKQLELLVYPNPAAEQITLRWMGITEEKYTLDVVDAQGNCVLKQSGLSQTGLQELQLPVHRLNKGNYALRITTDSQVFERIVFCKL